MGRARWADRPRLDRDDDCPKNRRCKRDDNRSAPPASPALVRIRDVSKHRTCCLWSHR